MASQVQWFGNADDERTVLRRVAPAATVSAFALDGGRLVELPEFSVDRLPPWPASVCVLLWRQDCGPLHWHERRPELAGDTHRAFVVRLWAREHWVRSAMADGDRLLDNDRSPVLCYQRPEILDGRQGPSKLMAPPGSPERVGADYATWAKRCLSWVRRQGRIVHDWRSPAATIPNPRQLLTTTHAFPSALLAIERGEHGFAVL
jgi:hypothetical protein